MEISTDGAPVFTSLQMKSFLSSWDVHYRVSSPYYARSNKQAEIGVKSSKCLIMGNLGHLGELITDEFARALLKHRNTPDQDTGLSPAMIIFGRELKSSLPNRPDKYQPRREWRLEADL